MGTILRRHDLLDAWSSSAQRKIRKRQAEVNHFFKAVHAVIIPLTVLEILEEEIVNKLA
jgi:hypothetical protein